ncbi:altered inheritance of mitochondria protein 32-like isoform X2 [Camellia sinensis]|uniref:altered inheritance of mitochondria protein 32-like isoform X2 n=1 Tax=Camellia sinensis TaxID=4442 RepID=UPI001035BBC1|nr:altered inheritance of mitochondria protein 32-like isoform X2 [Camellia sinensis]
MNFLNSHIHGDSTNQSNTDDDLKYGFQRQDMYKSSLAGTVDAYGRHVFLCYKSPDNWPASVEDPEFDPIPRLLSSALKSRNNQFHGKIRLTLCEGRDGSTESSNGDILIFPDMIRYRGLTHLDVDTFVDNVFVRGSQWASRVPETLTGSYVFVCCHQNRDKRCGLCGPVLVERFKEEIESRSMKHQVFVSPCSHLGGHQYAGNLIIFSLLEGKCEGHWGRMGSLNSEGKKFEEPKLQQNSCGLLNGTSCCSGSDRVSCCANKTVEENTGVGEKNMRDGTRTKGLGRL